jgi:DNA repair exonuclease SbcCD ATPase subunit
MDINQAMKMIEWLDEERRRDRNTMSLLEERLVSQQDTIDALQRRLNGMESEQTTLQSRVDSSHLGAGNELLESVRKEMRTLLEQQEAKRLNAEREVERRSEIAREGIMRPVRDVTDRLALIESQLSDLPGFQMERERTGEAVASVQQRIEDINKKLSEPERRLAFLEEQRRQDNRRLSEIQSELPEMQKQVDTIRPKVTLIEELALRNERKINETQNTESSRREQIQQFIDQQTLMLQQRDQQVQTLMDKFGEQDNAMERNLERFEQWSETHRAMKRVIEDFERIGDRLERRINEVAEMQRLSEERFRQEWNDWRSDDQKRFKQFTLANDEVWRNHDNEFERHVGRVGELEGELPILRESISRLWDLERARASLYREQYQALLMEFDTQENIRATATSTMPAIRATGTLPTANGLPDDEEDA